jgi:cell division protein FtsB
MRHQVVGSHTCLCLPPPSLLPSPLLTSGGGGGGGAEVVSSLKDQISKLTAENNKLKNELSAFDLDFFEEIENLKYSHAEAVRKLKAMEKLYGPSGGGR